jgi:hypothetical protein
MINIPPKFSQQQIANAMNEEVGYCIECGAEHYEIAADARALWCDQCQRSAVYGAEEIVLCFPERIV